MRPTFGCRLRELLMEPNTVALRTRLEREVSRALEVDEPRIRLLQVAASPGEDPAVVHVAIRYEHRVDRSESVLVYPFYLQR
jgi:uncharacterized protein